MSSEQSKAVAQLFAAPLYRYADWPNPKVPVSPGVFAVWENEELVWVGSADGSLRSRFERHARGQRRGSEFLKAVFSRLMFRRMDLEKAMQTAGETQLLVDLVTSKYVKKNLTYRFLPTQDEAVAEQISQLGRKGYPPYEKPFLNPID